MHVQGCTQTFSEHQEFLSRNVGITLTKSNLPLSAEWVDFFPINGLKGKQDSVFYELKKKPNAF